MASEPKKMIVVGGVAAGMSAASQAKRRSPGLEVTVFEMGQWVSYGACGMPYNIQDPARAIDDLVVITPEQFRKKRNIDVRIGHRVRAIDPQARTVTVEHAGGLSKFDWDRLVLATGCRAVHPDWDGLDLDGVFELHTLDQAARIKAYLADRSLGRAVVIGGGHIGLEMVDVLASRGLSVTLLKRSAALPSGYAPEISAKVILELERQGVEIITGQEIVGCEGRGRVQAVRTATGRIEADLVIVATGVRPEVSLAAEAGIRIGDSGAIAVDAFMRTSADGVFAAGDCAEAHHIVLGRGQFLPRGTTANKQGKIAGANAVGAQEAFRGVAGTSITKVFSLGVGHTGLLDEQAVLAGFDVATATIEAKTRAHSYPNPRDIAVRLTFERASGRLLGGQLVGGEGVAKRIDVLVAALYAGWTVDDLAALDLSYAPPFAPVWDPLLIAANIARKKTE